MKQDMTDDSLLLLASEVRSKTLRLLDGVSDEMSDFAAPGLANSILWHAGHALAVVEYLAVAPATGRPPVLPEGWWETFGWDSRPQTTANWPAIIDVVGALRNQLPRLTTAIAALSPSQLDRIYDQANGTTLRYDILHSLHDEANHQGEIWLLRKMYLK
jgi:DinB family protein